MPRKKDLPTAGGIRTKSDLTVRDVPSKGLSARISGLNPSEVHHVFSILERRYFYALLWSNRIVDIKTQQLLPLENTQEIADRMGIRHPINPKTHELAQMSTDFVLDVIKNDVTIIEARSVKPEKEIYKRRTVEKLEIERLYWVEKGIDWRLVTERQIPMTLAENVEWAYEALRLPLGFPIPEHQMEQVAQTLLAEIRGSDVSLASAALLTDERLGMPNGTSLWIAKHMIANRHWEVDMLSPIKPSERLEVLSISSSSLSSGGEYA